MSPRPCLAVFYKQRTSRFYPSFCFALQVVLMRLPFCFAESWVWTFMVGGTGPVLGRGRARWQGQQSCAAAAAHTTTVSSSAAVASPPHPTPPPARVMPAPLHSTPPRRSTFAWVSTSAPGCWSSGPSSSAWPPSPSPCSSPVPRSPATWRQPAPYRCAAGTDRLRYEGGQESMACQVGGGQTGQGARVCTRCPLSLARALSLLFSGAPAPSLPPPALTLSFHPVLCPRWQATFLLMFSATSGFIISKANIPGGGWGGGMVCGGVGWRRGWGVGGVGGKGGECLQSLVNSRVGTSREAQAWLCSCIGCQRGGGQVDAPSHFPSPGRRLERGLLGQPFPVRPGLDGRAHEAPLPLCTESQAAGQGPDTSTLPGCLGLKHRPGAESY